MNAVLPISAGASLEVSPASTWETEVLILCGADRGELRSRLDQLIAYLTTHPACPLQDLAYTLNTALAPRGSRLAIVAGSVAEVQARLARARERLADASCRHIKDAQGLYFCEQPLFADGKLAILFPGEGAPYPHMLRDLLPHFPEVRAHFERCDRLWLHAGNGRQRPISQILFPSADEQQAAARELGRADYAFASVLIADWALYEVLHRLGIVAQAFVGHSSGEVLALRAAGCLDPDDSMIERLFRLAQELHSQEEEKAVVLLATALERRQVEALIAQSGAALLVAMDNCPHQTVLAGPPADVALVEARLQAEGILCERLSSHRPYHTPRFATHLEPIRQMYQTVALRAAHTPIYSCMTARPFPAEPDVIRAWAVQQWAAPVEFVRTVEALYADGVRLFVEAGPRGNLTAFVEDILRGRPCLAVAANHFRRTGVTQLNHLVGQLAVHQVPLRLDYLYQHRQPRRVDWDRTALVLPPPRASDDRAAVLTRYCDVMHRFLDLQQDVVQRWLARRRSPVATSAPTRSLPLLGRTVRYEPGQMLVMRRPLDLAEDRYALDHTLGGRCASALDPNHHGLPVMPMAFSAEMLAEAAVALMPGKTVVALQQLQLHRWIVFDEDEPILLEIEARRLPAEQAGLRAVRVQIRDLGNARRPNRSDTPAVAATVWLAERYPVAPLADEFPLSQERPCPFTPQRLYGPERHLFHGPRFQAVCSVERLGTEGVEGHLQTLPHTDLLRSQPTPRFVTDPVLIDASTHVLGCWHLSQADETGRVVLPFAVGSLQLYGPPPPSGTKLRCRVRLLGETSRQSSHRIELITGDGRLWCVLTPANYWRFYWPEAFTAFFRHKDRYLLAQPWDAVAQTAGSPRQAARCVRLTVPHDLTQPVLRAVVARISLSRTEWRQFRSLTLSEEQLTTWVFTRLAAKDAVRLLWQEHCGEQLFPADFEMVSLPDGHFQARYVGHARKDLPTVAVACAGGEVLALAWFAPDTTLDQTAVAPLWQRLIAHWQRKPS